MDHNQEPFLNARRKFITRGLSSGALLAGLVGGSAKAVAPKQPSANHCNIRDFGASGGGTHLDTESIQGGRVCRRWRRHRAVPPGYLSLRNDFLEEQHMPADRGGRNPPAVS